MQHVLSTLIAEGDVLKPDPALNVVKLRAALAGGVLLQRFCQLIYKAERRFPPCEQCGQERDRLYQEVHQVHEHDDRARREPTPCHRKPCADKKYAQLRDDSRHGADHAYHDLQLAAAELFLLQRAVILGKETENLLLCLECLDQREPAETVRQRSGEVLIAL